MPTTQVSWRGPCQRCYSFRPEAKIGGNVDWYLPRGPSLGSGRVLPCTVAGAGWSAAHARAEKSPVLVEKVYAAVPMGESSKFLSDEQIANGWGLGAVPAGDVKAWSEAGGAPVSTASPEPCPGCVRPDLIQARLQAKSGWTGSVLPYAVGDVGLFKEGRRGAFNVGGCLVAAQPAMMFSAPGTDPGWVWSEAGWAFDLKYHDYVVAFGVSRRVGDPTLSHEQSIVGAESYFQ